MQIEENEFLASLTHLCHPSHAVLEKANKKKPQFTADEKVKVNLGFQNNNMKL